MTDLVIAAIQAERAAIAAFISQRISAVRAQVAAMRIDAESGALTVRQLEALAEMIAQGLHEGDAVADGEAEA